MTLTGAWASVTSTTTTDASGNYSFLLPTNVSSTISAPVTTTSTSTGGAGESLIYATNGTAGTTFNHTSSASQEVQLPAAQGRFTVTASAAAAISGINFGSRLADTAPTISTWGITTPGGAVQYTMSGPAVVLSTGSTGVADTQLDSLVTNGIGDYSGTVLRLVRNGGANANDVFGGAGNATTGLFFSGGNVLFNGATVGTFTMTGGTLLVTFASGTNAASVQNVLNNVTYANSGSSSQIGSGILINATLSDHNTQTGTTSGNAFQGTGGVMTSTQVQVLIEIAPATASDAFQEPNDLVTSGTGRSRASP